MKYACRMRNKFYQRSNQSAYVMSEVLFGTWNATGNWNANGNGNGWWKWKWKWKWLGIRIRIASYLWNALTFSLSVGTSQAWHDVLASGLVPVGKVNKYLWCFFPLSGASDTIYRLPAEITCAVQLYFFYTSLSDFIAPMILIAIGVECGASGHTYAYSTTECDNLRAT